MPLSPFSDAVRQSLAPRSGARHDQHALTASAVDAILAEFESDREARAPGGGQYLHRDPDGLRAVYEQLFSNDGGISRGRPERCSTAAGCSASRSTVRACWPARAGAARS
jgi:hypothetical protein